MTAELEHSSLKSFESAAVSAGHALAAEAYQHRIELGAAALGIASAVLGKGLLVPVIEKLATTLRPATTAIADLLGGAEVQAGELTFSDLCQKMAARSVTLDDLAGSVRPSRFLGRGFEHESWTAAKLPEYVLRKAKNLPVKIGELKPVDIIVPEANFGQQVGETGSLQILRRLQGTPLVSRRNTWSFWYPTALRLQARKLAALPQETYDHLAHTLGSLSKHQLYLDPVGDNLLLNSRTQRFGLLDLVPAHKVTNTVWNNGESNLVGALLPGGPEGLQPYYNQVVAKLSLAARKAGLPA